MKRTIFAIAVTALGLAACSPTVDTGGSLQGSWELVEGTVDGENIPLTQGFPITMNVTEDGVDGRAACNSYFGNYELDGSNLTLSQIGATEMACMPENVMAAESMYLTALTRVESYSLESEALQLAGPGLELAFALLPPVPEAALLGTVWVLDGLILGDAVSSVRGEPATLELFGDGSMLGSTGCRTLTGSYVVSGSEVVMTELAAHGECPQDLFDQDSQVVSVLGDGFRVEIDGPTLTLTSMGEEGLVYQES